ncbi:Protein containing aminopeptidase domain [hydrothermal vent metagenome]|uniref:Protein containing aminopeptidase domain n=1 Tax=hydrothermal vent metagenome TaxID=652676 RepID=A0A3B0YSH0_9ZZZZ
MNNDLGRSMYNMMNTLYPICRSITGNGVRDTLAEIKNHIDIKLSEVSTGTQVFDWTVPKEWNIRDAYVISPKGEKIIDFKVHNLHVLNYSAPIKQTVSLATLREHVYTMPEHPDWIPYRTSYYNENWGFCMAHNDFLKLEEGDYEVVVDSSLTEGSLTYGEFFIQGESDQEILISCHICHPSLCNDNLSGIALSTMLAKQLLGKKLKYSYRFLFIPGTIGSITWLSRNQEKIKNIKHGLVVVCVGDEGKFHYKRSKSGDAYIDRAVENVLRNSGHSFDVIDFYPYGYDERQYSSPGINLDVGSLSRSSHGQYDEYHTSKDDMDLISEQALSESLECYLSVVDVLENDRCYTNLSPMCEPQLGKRGLYRKLGASEGRVFGEMALLWVLNMTDGKTTLLDISNRASLPFSEIKNAALALQQAKLLQ